METTPKASVNANKVPFQVTNYHVSIRGNNSGDICEATVQGKLSKLMKGRLISKEFHTVSDGTGPINALDGALRLALIPYFPKLKNVHLTNFKVSIADPENGTAAKTRVLIYSSDGLREWETIGIHSDIVRASLDALKESFEQALL